MVILHTADIHFHQSTLADLVAPCARIVDYASEHQPDHIIIAGDLTTERGIIDNATAVAMRSWINQLAKFARVWVLAGNHDLTYREGQPNNLRAILADNEGSVLEGVEIIDSPCVHIVRDGDGRDIALGFVPYPSVPTFHSVTGSADLGDVSDTLVDVVKGLAVEASDAAMSLLVYHGTVEGGRTGDESAPSLRTRGADVVLPTTGIGPWDAVLCGHLHHPQTIMAGAGMKAFVYPGCIAPLTFGERTIQPGVELWTLQGGSYLLKRLPLPVTHQRLQVEVGPDDWDETRDAKLNLWQWVNRLDAPPNSRVKVKAVLPSPRLALLNAETIEAVRGQFALDRLVVEKTEHEVAKLLLEAGQDRAARVNVVESLERYGEYIGDATYTQHLDDIRSVAREIEDVMPGDTDPRYGFEPLRLELHNYKQFTDVTVDFTSLPQSACVLGPTGIGKSNLTLAIAAALYGGNPKSEGGKAKASLGSMVRRGETSGHLRLEFRGHTGTYRITRRFKVAGNGKGSSALYLEQLRAGTDEWVSINEGTGRETQTAIERVVGPEALHWLTRHLRQHGVSAVKMTAGELGDAINSTLQLNFEARAELAKEMFAFAIRERDRSIARRDALAEQIVPENTITAQEQHVERRKREAESEGQRHQQLLERMEAERGQLEARREKHQRDVQQLGERNQRRESIQRQLDEAEQALARLEHERDALGAAPDVAALEAADAEARDRLDSAQADLTQARELKHQSDMEAAKTAGAMEQSRMAAATKRRDAYQRHEAAKRALEDAGRAAALIDSVPCRGESWHDPNEGEMDGGACELLADAHYKASRLATLADSELEASKALRLADADHEAAHAAAERAKATAETLGTKAGEGVRAAEKAVEGAAGRVQATARALTTAREHMARAVAVAQRLAPAAERVAVLREQHDGIAVNVGHLRESQQALQEVTERLQDLDAAIKSARERVAEHRDQLVRCDADLEQLALERKQRADMLREVATCKQTAEQSERRRVALDYYRQAVSRSGIPSLLLEQLAPQLEARVNSILEPVGRALRIDTERETTTGKVRTEVTLSFRSPSTGDEFVPIAELSGGEEDLCNLALAAGLARVSADMSGTTLGTVILDEPCAGVSESLQGETLEVLHRINRHVARSIVVTHRRDLAVACDATLEVSRNGAGSVVEIQK